LAGVVLLAAFAGACGSGNSQSSSGPTVPVPANASESYLARTAARVDRLQWTVTGLRLSGSLDSRWVTSADPTDLQSGSVNFSGILQGMHLTLSPDDGSAAWSGAIDGTRLVLQWISAGRRLTTTFFAARIGDFDLAVQVLGEEVATAATRAADAAAAAAATRAAQAAQAKQAQNDAKRAAALARAEAGRLSAAKAAAHRRRHPHP
jgi:hypothetical protein